MLFPILLVGCKAEKGGQTVSGFSLNAAVSWNDFSYECSVVSSSDAVTVTVQSTSAAGLVITYNGKSVTMSYEDMDFTQNNKNFDPTNPAIAIYDVVQYINGSGDLQPQTTKDGFLVKGETALGAFTLETDKELLPVSLSFSDTGLTFRFYRS